MDSVSIGAYMIDGMFLHNPQIVQAYDLIVCEALDDDIYTELSVDIQKRIYRCDSLYSDISIKDFLHELDSRSVRILCVIQQLLFHDIVPCVSASQRCIVETMTGVSSIGNKLYIDEFYPVADTKAIVYEPITIYDLQHVLCNTKKADCIHVRLGMYDVPAQWISGMTDQLIACDAYGYTGSSATIVSVGPVSLSVLQVADMLQQNGKGCEIFIANKRDMLFDEAILLSARQTRKCIYVLDIITDEATMQMMKKINLAIQSISDKISIYLLCPEYASVTSIAPEYMYEQAHRDVQGIYDKLEYMLS